jgi:hypothetical protein
VSARFWLEVRGIPCSLAEAIFMIVEYSVSRKSTVNSRAGSNSKNVKRKTPHDQSF